MKKDVFRAKLLKYISTNEVYKAYHGDTNQVKSVSVKALVAEDGEIEKYYTLNQTGNLMISSTVKNEIEISKDVKEVFQKVIVFFSAWTVALSQKGKTLFDAEAITSIIENSGFFIRIHQEDRTFKYTALEGTLNLAII